LVTVAPQIGVRDHFILLVVMAKDQQTIAHLPPDGFDAKLQVLRRNCFVRGKRVSGFDRSGWGWHLGSIGKWSVRSETI
jgi:hypothetical protein